MADIIEVEGIGKAYAAKLTAAGVTTTEALLKRGGAPKGRAELAATTGLSGKRLLGWVNRADLMRVNGVGEEYSDLLELAGVDTVPELAQRNPDNLLKAMADANKKHKVVRHLPSLAHCKDWIDQAKKLPRKVTY